MRTAIGAALVLGCALGRPLGAQTCTWGGTSSVPPPAVVALATHGNSLAAPGRVAVDALGRSYTTEPTAGRVVVRDAWGRWVGMKEGFLRPLAVAVGVTGDILVSELGTRSVSVYDSDWNLQYKLGQGEGEFVLPNDLALGPLGDVVYVSDGGAHQIRLYDLPGGALRGTLGGPGSGIGQFNFPAGLYVSGAGEVFVADQNNDRIQVFAADGSVLRCFGRSGGMALNNKFGRLLGLTGDALGRLYVADGFQGQVRVFDSEGVELAAVGTFGAGAGELATPMGLAIDSYGRLLVGSVNNRRLERFGLDAYRNPSLVAGQIAFSLPEATPSSNSTGLGRRAGAGRRSISDPRSSAKGGVRGDDRWRQPGPPPRRVTARLTAPRGNLELLHLASLRANGLAALAGQSSYEDADQDGVVDALLVSFRVDELVATLSASRTVVVSGVLRNLTPFEAVGTLPASVGGER
jgi:hypothetical protein